MTICKTFAEALQTSDERKFSRIHKRVRRQESFEIMEDEIIFENEDYLEEEMDKRSAKFVEMLPDSVERKSESPSADGLVQRTILSQKKCRECHERQHRDLRKRLSVEDLTTRAQNRSSLILDWLANPDNKFMFQGRYIDSRIFRSYSAVENRPVSNFIKTTRFHSLRHQGKDGRALTEDDNVFCDSNDTYSGDSECTREKDVAVESQCAKGPVMTKADCIFKPEISGQNHLDYGMAFERRDHKACQYLPVKENHVFGTANIVNNALSREFHELDLSRETSRSFNDHKSIVTCKSLPSYSKSTNEGKLRRMNSDAFFYKGMLRDCDGRNSDKRSSNFISRKRRNRLSLQLRDLVDTDRTNLSLDTGIYSLESKAADSAPDLDVNSKEFINNIDKIFSCGDLQQIRELAELGFDFNTKDGAGNCALHYAALRGSEKIITEILENGGNVWARNNNNQLPVELASNINVRMLLSGVTLFYRGQYSKEIESRLTSKAMNFEL